MKNEKTDLVCAVVPGSFDPMTLGHLDVVRRAATVFDCVYVAVMINADKKYVFDMETRKKIAEATCEGLENVTVVADDGYLVKLAEKLGCCAIVKGIRNSDDYVYEEKMAMINRRLAPEIQTLFIPCEKEHSEVSSTAVRFALAEGDTAKAAKLMVPSAFDIAIREYCINNI